MGNKIKILNEKNERKSTGVKLLAVIKLQKHLGIAQNDNF
jgi:hypothetical protein